MKLPTDTWGELIIYLIETNLDITTKRRWEEYTETKENLTANDTIEFLQRRYQILERASLGKGSGSGGKLKFGNLDKFENSKSKLSHLKSQGKVLLNNNSKGSMLYVSGSALDI